MHTIVAVDDDLSILTIVEKALGDLYELHTFNSGLKFLDEITSLKPSLIILDAQMPEIDGFELCTKLKSMDHTKNLPIIFVSAKSGSNTRTLAYKLGAISFLEKPIELIEFRCLVASVLKQLANVSYDQLEFGNLSVDKVTLKGKAGSSEFVLTNSELIILSTLMENEGAQVTRERLANLLSFNDEISFRTIDTHISAIRKKIKFANVKIVSVYGIGYMMVEHKLMAA